MRTLVIIAHPDLDNSLVNKTWMQELQKYEDVTVHPLYQRYPDGVIDGERERSLLLNHDRIVLQFPLYWYSSPHLLHLWQERVLAYGWAYGPGGTQLHGKQFVLAVSTGGPAISYQAGGYNNYSMSEILKPFQQMCNLIGGQYLAPFILHGARVASPAEIQTSAQQYAEYIRANKH